MRERPIGVTILAILAGIAAVIAAVHALQFLGIFPFVIGSSGYKVHAFSFWYALMYGLLVWVYIWLTTMLWRVEPQAWMFLVPFNRCQNTMFVRCVFSLMHVY